MKVSVQVKDLKVNYDLHTALSISELSLSGSIIAVIGHNGAGKSTMIKTILGLLAPRCGSITVCSDAQHGRYQLLPEVHMAFCPETGSVFEDISVEQYIKLWCRIKHQDAKFYRKEGHQIIELLSIAPLLKKLGRELSKGQRRRVQSAIGFLCKPKLFLFDEPFDGLDVQRTSELVEIMQSHVPDMAFLVSSHRMDVVERIADAVIVLQEGKVLHAGSVSEVSRSLFNGSFQDAANGNGAPHAALTLSDAMHHHLRSVRAL